MFALLSQAAERPSLMGMMAISIASMSVGLVLLWLTNRPGPCKPNASERLTIGCAIVGAIVVAAVMGLVKWWLHG
jgi:peptidoglycan biosynthesis protein MviN/MurJ (putative lipid II flippase)